VDDPRFRIRQDEEIFFRSVQTGGEYGRGLMSTTVPMPLSRIRLQGLDMDN